MISPNKLLGSLIYRTREKLRKDKKFIRNVLNSPYGKNCFPNDEFNIMYYPGTISEIKNILFDIDKGMAMRSHKYPAFFSYMSVEENFDVYRTLVYNISIVGLTDKDWLTEQREEYVFDPVLRPIYEEFKNQINSHVAIVRYDNRIIPHRKYDVFTTGRVGEALVVEFPDWIDAIDLRNLTVRIPLCDDRYYSQIVEEYNKLTNL